MKGIQSSHLSCTGYTAGPELLSAPHGSADRLHSMNNAPYMAWLHAWLVMPMVLVPEADGITVGLRSLHWLRRRVPLAPQVPAGRAGGAAERSGGHWDRVEHLHPQLQPARDRGQPARSAGRAGRDPHAAVVRCHSSPVLRLSLSGLWMEAAESLFSACISEMHSLPSLLACSSESQGTATLLAKWHRHS